MPAPHRARSNGSIPSTLPLQPAPPCRTGPPQAACGGGRLPQRSAAAEAPRRSGRRGAAAARSGSAGAGEGGPRARKPRAVTGRGGGGSAAACVCVYVCVCVAGRRHPHSHGGGGGLGLKPPPGEGRQRSHKAAPPPPLPSNPAPRGHDFGRADRYVADRPGRAGVAQEEHRRPRGLPAVLPEGRRGAVPPARAPAAGIHRESESGGAGFVRPGAAARRGGHGGTAASDSEPPEVRC